MYMFMFFNYCMYHVCQLKYNSIVNTLYIHGTDMYIHFYARWSLAGFQMRGETRWREHQSARASDRESMLERERDRESELPSRVLGRRQPIHGIY